MEKVSDYVEVYSNGEIVPKEGINVRVPYEHQKEAMKCLDKINQEESFSTLVVLPTGGGKTYTAAIWLLKNAIDKKKKILWIAHRQMLLDQAAESFQKYAYTEFVPHISSFSFRIISGSSNHDRTIDISNKDKLLIASKDSIGRNIDRLDKWLEGEQEIYLIVDEAHHSSAKTYRKIIDHIKEKVPKLKIVGLTATPFRTAESEKRNLSYIYTDGIKDGQVVKGDVGITYEIGLKELINRQILSKPIFECYYTEEKYGKSLGLDAYNSIQNFDKLPEEIAEKMASSAARNKLIVDTYKAKQDEYGQTIIFAVNIVHAIHLNALFKKAGIPSGYVVSSIRDLITGVTLSNELNNETIEQYRSGKIKVLINVNILTEGVDLPQTKTVFLARPTVSSILMTQMVGRALRGTAAGGTSSAYIVSFIDKWNENISWVNPESLFVGEGSITDNDTERIRKDLNMIAISKIEEFASLLDNSIDTSKLEKVPFKQRIPIGMYVFSYLEENGMDHSYQVMVYDSTKESYENLMDSLSELFESFGVEEEYLTNDQLNEMEKQCRDTLFCGELVPPYESRDILNILKYYAQCEMIPEFYTFDYIDKSKLDITAIAEEIWNKNMGQRERTEYINSIWEQGDGNLFKLFFGKKIYFIRSIDIELIKIAFPDNEEDKPIVIPGGKNIEDLTLAQIGALYSEYEKYLRDKTFEKSLNEKGEYQCACCGKTSKKRIIFNVDHIVPMNKGGKSVLSNLQILCRQCNGRKGDK